MSTKRPPPTPDRRLDGHVALVTGGAAGIGRAMCRALARAGASVSVVDIDEERALDLVAELTAGGATAIAVGADVRDPTSVKTAVARTQRLGRVDILVNNAGVTAVAPLIDHDLARWREVFAVNVEGALLCTQSVAKIMIAQEPSPILGCRGKIVNIGSGAAEVGRPLLAAYGASKAALNHLAKSTAAALADELVATTVVYPTTVADGMWGTLGEDLAGVEGRTAGEVIGQRLAEAPTGRFQTAEEVAEIVLYVASWRGMELNGRLVWSEAHVASL